LLLRETRVASISQSSTEVMFATSDSKLNVVLHKSQFQNFHPDTELTSSKLTNVDLPCHPLLKETILIEPTHLNLKVVNNKGANNKVVNNKVDNNKDQ